MKHGYTPKKPSISIKHDPGREGATPNVPQTNGTIHQDNIDNRRKKNIKACVIKFDEFFCEHAIFMTQFISGDICMGRFKTFSQFQSASNYALHNLLCCTCISRLLITLDFVCLFVCLFTCSLLAETHLGPDGTRLK